jgi:hypothetical protein
MWWRTPEGAYIVTTHPDIPPKADRLDLLRLRYRIPKVEVDPEGSWCYPEGWSYLVTMYGRPPRQAVKLSPWPRVLYGDECGFLSDICMNFRDTPNRVKSMLIEADLLGWSKAITPATDLEWLDVLERAGVDLSEVHRSLAHELQKHPDSKAAALYRAYLDRRR